jgi:hypothetical protein
MQCANRHGCPSMQAHPVPVDLPVHDDSESASDTAPETVRTRKRARLDLAESGCEPGPEAEPEMQTWDDDCIASPSWRHDANPSGGPDATGSAGTAVASNNVQTRLHEAVQAGDLAQVHAALRLGADPNLGRAPTTGAHRSTPTSVHWRSHGT